MKGKRTEKVPYGLDIPKATALGSGRRVKNQRVWSDKNKRKRIITSLHET